MKTRMNYKEAEPRVYESMLTLERQVKAFGLEPILVELIKIRVSQLNGCGYCLSMHCRDARRLGETNQRLDTLSAWRETTLFTPEEQAVLAFTEEVTQLSQHGVSESTYQQAEQLLGSQKLAQITLAIIVINGWNRIALATRMLAQPE
ncbi:MAG: carboxymuconolactone decarboxylase family protein [Spirosomataceae bacterium]